MSAKGLLLALGLLALMPTALLAQQRVRCESTDFRYQQCRVDVRGEIRLERQLSQAACIQGRTWGINNAGIWVDQGCAAEFRIEDYYGGGGYPGGGYPGDSYPDGGTRQLVCESRDFRYQQCRVDVRGGVELTRQLSSAPCRRNSTWGVNQDGIWVDQGCVAEFRVGVGGDYRPPGSGSGSSGVSRLVCESPSHRYQHCRADVSRQVRLSRQLSRQPCIQGDTWGVDRSGVWVDRGCAAEFTLGGGRRGGFTPYHELKRY